MLHSSFHPKEDFHFYSALRTSISTVLSTSPLPSLSSLSLTAGQLLYISSSLSSSKVEGSLSRSKGSLLALLSRPSRLLTPSQRKVVRKGSISADFVVFRFFSDFFSENEGKPTLYTSEAVNNANEVEVLHHPHEPLYKDQLSHPTTTQHTLPYGRNRDARDESLKRKKEELEIVAQEVRRLERRSNDWKYAADKMVGLMNALDPYFQEMVDSMENSISPLNPAIDEIRKTVESQELTMSLGDYEGMDFLVSGSKITLSNVPSLIRYLNNEGILGGARLRYSFIPDSNHFSSFMKKYINVVSSDHEIFQKKSQRVIPPTIVEDSPSNPITSKIEIPNHLGVDYEIEEVDDIREVYAGDVRVPWENTLKEAQSIIEVFVIEDDEI